MKNFRCKANSADENLSFNKKIKPKNDTKFVKHCKPVGQAGKTVSKSSSKNFKKTQTDLVLPSADALSLRGQPERLKVKKDLNHFYFLKILPL